MAKLVSEKMGLKEGARAIFVDVPGAAIKSIDPPNLYLTSRLSGNFDYIHYFVVRQAALKKKFPKLKFSSFIELSNKIDKIF